MTPPITLTIAGSDPTAGAGIQADLKTFSALGVYGASVLTTVTAQNTRGVRSLYPLPVEVVRDQLRAVLEDLDVAAIKIGMIGNREIAAVILEELHGRECPIVLDPISNASHGASFTDGEPLVLFLQKLIPRALLVTPNIPEAEELTGVRIDSVDAIQIAGELLLTLGAKNVLIKGGHASGEEMIDVLVTSGESYRYSSPKIESNNLHGTGCTLSSAIAARLALGDELPDAVRIAKEFVTGAILSARERTIGGGNGPLDHEWQMRQITRETSLSSIPDIY